MKIVEATIFWNEDHYFEEKVRNALSYADQLVIAEASVSFSGLVKRPFRAKKLLKKLERPLRKRVVILELKNVEGTNAWEREAFVRNAPLEYITKNRESDDFLIVVQDFDEFFDGRKRGRLLELFKLGSEHDLLHLNYYCSYFYLNNMILAPEDHFVWRLPVVARFRYVQAAKATLNGLRSEFLNIVSQERFGWHHSYIGSRTFIEQKIRSFSHFNDREVKEMPPERIEEVLASGKDLFDRPFVFEKRLDYRQIGIPELMDREDLYFPGTYVPDPDKPARAPATKPSLFDQLKKVFSQ